MMKYNKEMGERRDRLIQFITIALGCFWVVDGVLQLQPSMFTAVFVNNVLAPNLQSQPVIIERIIASGIQIFSTHLFLANLLSALIQLCIGAALLLSRDKKVLRVALWTLIVWAFIIWIFGEGLGLLFTGSASFYTGAPGSALLYLLLALFLIRAQDKPDSIDSLPLVAGIVFILGAALNLMPMFWQPTMLSMLSAIPRVSGWLGRFGGQGTMLGNIIAFDALLCIGIFLVALPNRIIGWIALAFLLAIWWVGQYFGGIMTFPFGAATDPNSAPVLVLFVLPLILVPMKGSA